MQDAAADRVNDALSLTFMEARGNTAREPLQMEGGATPAVHWRGVQWPVLARAYTCSEQKMFNLLLFPLADFIRVPMLKAASATSRKGIAGRRLPVR
jgi:hypothetical protein